MMTSGSGARRRDPLRSSDPAAVGPYRLQARLGTGGMGVVYLAVGRDGRRVAVKMIHEHLAAHPEFQARFAREIGNARRVRSPYTPAVLDAVHGSLPSYLVTEYVDGPTLDQQVREFGPLSPSALAQLGLNLLSAINSFHRAGIVHRDIKPSNIVIGPGGPQVVDFGISRTLEELPGITRDGAVVGTPEFMAPEQWLGHSASPATDIYAWACVLTFAGTGRPPCRGHIEMIRQSAVSGIPDLGGLDPRFRNIVLQALSKKPEQRPSADRLTEWILDRYPVGANQDNDPARSGTPTVRTSLSDTDITDALGPSMPASARLPHRRLLLGGAATILVTSVAAGGARILGSGGGGDSSDPSPTPPSPRGARVAEMIADRADQLRPRRPEVAKKLDLAAYRAGATPRTTANLLRHSLVESIDPFAGELESVCFHPGGDLVAMAGESGVIRLWNRVTRTYTDLAGHGERVLSVRFSPGGDMIVSGGEDRTIRAWDLSSAAMMWQVSCPENVFRLVFSPDGRNVAAGVNDGTVRMLAANSGRPSAPILDHAATGKVPSWIWSLAFHGSGQFLATAGDAREGRALKLWNLNGQVMVPLELGHEFGPVGAVAFNPRRPNMLAVADRRITLIDVGEQESAPRGFDASDKNYTCLAFSPDGKSIAVGGDDPTLRIWDTGETLLRAELAGHTADVHDLSYGSDGKIVVSVGKDGNARFWSTDAAEVAGRLCADPGLRLTADEWEANIPDVAIFQYC